MRKGETHTPRSVKIRILQRRWFHAVGLFAFAVCVVLTASRSTLARLPAGSLTENSRKAFDSARSCTSLAGIRDAKEALDALQRPPARVTIMTYRYVHLCETLAAYKQTGVPLIAFDGSRYFQPGRGDDSGMFYYIPRLARFFGTDLDLTIDLFYGGIATISFLVGLTGLLFLLKSVLTRVLATVLLLIVFGLSFLKGDNYVFQSSIVVAIVPWFLYFVRAAQFSGRLLAFFVIAGLYAGVSNNMRAHAGTLVIIFVAWITVLCFRWRLWQRVLLLGLMLLGLSLPLFFLKHSMANRDSYLTAIQPSNVYPPKGRAYWHTIYIGFGFLSNPYIPAYSDSVAMEKAEMVSPGVLFGSPEYERILRKEVFAFVRQHPAFALLTLSAKLGAIGVVVLLSVNVGPLLMAFYPKDWRLESAFWLAIAFGSLSSILAVPRVQYLLGSISFGVLYCVVSIEHATNCLRSGNVHARFIDLILPLRDKIVRNDSDIFCSQRSIDVPRPGDGVKLC